MLIHNSAQYYTLAAQTDVAPPTVFQHDPKTFPVFMLVWLEKCLIFKSCPMHRLCLLANQPQVIQHEVAAGDVHSWCRRCSPVKYRTGINTSLCIVWPHTDTSFSFHFPVSFPRSLFDRYLVLKQGKKQGGRLKWSLKTWSNSLAALVMSPVLTSYQSWQVFMWCFALGDTVCTCPLGFAEIHLSSA